MRTTSAVRYVEILEADAILAITRDISLRGIAFTHDDQFEGAYAIVLFDDINEQSVSLLLEVQWSNIEQDDYSCECGCCYMSGGRFFGITDSPRLAAFAAIKANRS